MSEQQIKQILKRLDDQDEALKAIHATLAPISETYKTANAIKKFAYAAVIAAGTIAGSILAVRELIKWK